MRASSHLLGVLILHLSLCWCHSLDHYSFVDDLELGSVSPPNFFFFKVVLVILDLLHFRMNFRINTLPAQRSAGSLLGIMSVDKFGSIAVLTMLKPPIHKLGVYLDLLSQYFIVFGT
jgi:hypothetical protein